MSKTPSVADDAVVLLCADIYGHLDEMEFVAGGSTDPLLAGAVRSAVLVLRGLVAEHGTLRDATCWACGGEWPCRVFSTVHGLIKNPDGEYVALLRRLRAAERRE
ncbi:hypothetical protein EV193_103277 [Herbihabitans rhizosphaerae]|uniref:Uncharacterized protein n=1 Tax=Herbihabitans rhizosphaerae TaxID=1872711 RepID=A0A4Q7KVC5_9PSEU|nr:hypothetical protein [Herbihabitans rhizosphaerae]RZS40959.1 hypothetical protein EV193_103277 [Herbihabitans rhizosphaerae]